MRHTLRSWLAAASLFGLTWLAGCGGGGGGGGETPTPVAPTTASVQVQAQALDGSALAGVDVRASSGATARSDAQGKLTLSVPSDQDVTLAFSKADLANQVKVLRLPAGSTSATLAVTLIARQAALTLADIGVGGTVSGQDGVRAEFPAGSLVDAAGQVVSGAVQVQMTPVNVLAQTAAFPGRFAGIQGNAPPVAIVSFGTAEFVPMQNGQKLQVAPGKTVAIEIPMYADKNTDGSAVRLGQVIPLWSLNESTGVWLQEGTGTVVASPSSPTGLALRASVSHFTWWNCDDISGPKLTVNIRCLLLDAAGNPTRPMAAGQVCVVVGLVPDNARRPVQQANELVGPAGLQNVEIPANTVVELSATSIFGGERLLGFTSVKFPPGAGAVRDVVIALVTPVDVNLSDPFPGTTLPVAATARAQAFGQVDRVEMFLGGVEVAQGNNVSFDFSFNTRAVAEGFTTLQARAVRNDIVVGVSDAVPVIIDRSPPVVTLTRLNATAGDGRVELLAQVSDLSRIERVEFFRGNTLVGQSTAFPFTFTYTLLPGDTPSVDFSAQARDAAHNLGTSNVISFGTLAPTITLARSPTTTTITSSQTLTFTATAASNNGNGINRVEFFKGATKLGEDSSVPYEQATTVTGADEPALNVTAKAIDNAGIAATASLNVPVNISSGDTVPPTVALDAIASPVTIGALELAATATDNVAVAKVEFYVNDVFQGERTTLVSGKYRQAVDVSLLDGLTRFEARAFDAAGNPASSTQTATVTIVATLLAGAGDQLPHSPTTCAPSLAFASDGTPHVAHVVRDPATGAFDARVSRRVGGVWQSLGNVNDGSSRIQEFECATIGMAAGDVPFVAFVSQQGRTGPGELRLIVRRLNGVNWETSRELQANNTDLIQIAADNAGRPVIVWSGLAFGSDHRLNVERFNGTAWIVLASGFGSVGGQGAGAYRFTVRPDNEIVVASNSGIGAGGQAVLAFRVNDGGAFALADASRVIDQTGGGGGVGVLDVAANATEIVVTYNRFLGGQSQTTRVVRFNEAATRWDLVGREEDQLSPQRSTALVFQGGTLVQVASSIVQSSFGTEARRLNGATWSGLTPLQPVRSAVARAVIDRGALFIVYTHLTECCGPGGVGVARLNVP